MMEQQKSFCTKRVCPHANPLFEKWLLEWKAEAENSRSNNKYNLHRAVLSLRKFPLPVYSGDDCRILANFGDKICKMIDKKLAKFIAENGPINWEDHIKVTNVKKSSFKQKHRSSSSTKDAHPQIPKATSKGPEKKRGREYLPAYRSGAYALLVALLEASEEDGFPGYLKKEELISKAQPLSDASFTIPPLGSHYTAFSSMSTLIKKGLTTKVGNPARYSLTEGGVTLANRVSNHQGPSQDLFNIEDTIKPKNDAPAPPPQKESSPAKIHELSSSDGESDLEVTVIDDNAQPRKIDDDLEVSIIDNINDHCNENGFIYPTPSTSSSTEDSDRSQKLINSYSGVKNATNTGSTALSFVYVDVLGRDAMLKEKASVHVDIAKGFFGFLIKCNLHDLRNCKFKYQLDYSREAPPSMAYAYLSDDFAPDTSPGLCKTSSHSTERREAKLVKKSLNVATKGSKGPSLESKAAVSKEPGLTTQQKTRMIKMPNSSSCSTNTVPLVDFSSSYTLVPGSFKVLLCVDNQEVLAGVSSTSKRGTKEIIINELNKHGVDFHVRKLHVGDFLWVCQELNPARKPRELVLPFVIERKRMDDLASSMKDGRFKEQKFRLKQTGLTHPIYLVEQFGSNYLSLPLSTCEQAIANTQIIDNFHVKVTLDQKESAAYLTVMTRYLQGLFKNKTLECIEQRDFLKSHQDFSSSVYNLMDFDEFNLASMKNRQLSVREMFAKHLIQLSGLSVDKAASILQKYPTPSDLMKALSDCDDHSKEKLFATLKCPSSGRALGPSLSSQLAKLYNQAILF